ncbi:MAG: hypothetical protein Q8R00_04365 [Candidatus Nanoarchaeia archaeon]|nr:hypothetical protein [Candidatus Nanoarchaeia archaeon]
MKIDYVIKEIKKKKELKDLSEDFIKDRVNEYIKTRKIELSNLDERSGIYKTMFKEIRKICFDSYGLFKSGKSLKTHISTKERLNYYPVIYEKIFEIIGKPNKILDLGCGLNPLSYDFLGCNPEYYAVDLSESELETVNNYFKENKIKGKTYCLDLLKLDYSALPKVDVAFLFKVLESLENIHKNVSYTILSKINSKWIVVSFSKKSITGKPIIKKGRSWLKRMLAELGYWYEVLDIGDEIFYIIKKS